MKTWHFAALGGGGAVAVAGMGLWAGLLGASALFASAALLGPPAARPLLAPYAFVLTGIALVISAATFRGLPF